MSAMRVPAAKPFRLAADGPAVEEISLSQICVRLEQRMLAALEGWEAEKERLQEAVSRAEAKEREFREIADDVRKRLEAVNLVAQMAREMEPSAPTPAQLPEPAATEQPPAEEERSAAEEKPSTDLAVHTSSRPLFSQEVRSGMFAMLR